MKNIKMEIDLDDFLEWLFYDSDKITLVNSICRVLKEGCKPYKEAYPDTNRLFDGRYISEECILNVEELIDNNLVEYNSLGDIIPKINIKIEWK